MKNVLHDFSIYHCPSSQLAYQHNTGNNVSREKRNIYPTLESSVQWWSWDQGLSGFDPCWVGLCYGGKPLSVTLPLSSAGTQTSLVTREKLSGKLHTMPFLTIKSILPFFTIKPLKQSSTLIRSHSQGIKIYIFPLTLH